MQYFFLVLFLFPTLLFSKDKDIHEFFEYKITWKFVTVGYSTYSTNKNANFDGKKVWMFESTARGNAVIQAMFPVEDRIISLWDPITQRTLWHEKSLSEGNYRRTNRVHFNYESKKAVWWQSQYAGNIGDDGLFKFLPRTKEKNGVIESIDEKMNDILSLIYLTRISEEKPSPDQEFKIPIFDDNRLSNVWIKVIRYEDIDLNVNEEDTIISSLLVEPKLETSGAFRSKGKLRVWISNDELRIPVKIQAEIPNLGMVEANLYKMKI
jgi:hypothetical protein